MDEDLFSSDVETTGEFLNPAAVRLLCSSSDVTLLDDPADCANSDELGICYLTKKIITLSTKEVNIYFHAYMIASHYGFEDPSLKSYHSLPNK